MCIQEVESGERCDKKSPTSPSKPKTLSLRSGEAASSGDSTDEEWGTPSAENVPLPGERKIKVMSYCICGYI